MKKVRTNVLFVALLLGMSSIRCGSSSSLLSSGSSLMSSLASNPNLSTFTSLLKTPGLGKALGGAIKPPFTLLAPTNEALSGMGAGALGNLTDPNNVGQIANLVKSQVIPGKLDPTALAKGGVTNAAGNAVNLSDATLGAVTSDEKFNIIPVNKILQ